jgi:hypothetical protein
MSRHERRAELSRERALSRDSRSAYRDRRRQRRKRRRRVFAKVVKTAGLLWVATFAIVAGMIATGHLFGPRGVEGLLALPIVLTLTWAAILFFSLRSKPSTETIVVGDVAQLPARTEEWLEGQRRALPAAAREQLDSIVLQLEALTPQLATLDPQLPAAQELRRLLGEELPELVRGYQKVPRALQQQPLDGGASPDRQLSEGLNTVGAALGRLHERLAADDLRALATQQRYLEMKYKRDGELE